MTEPKARDRAAGGSRRCLWLIPGRPAAAGVTAALDAPLAVLALTVTASAAPAVTAVPGSAHPASANEGNAGHRAAAGHGTAASLAAAGAASGSLRAWGNNDLGQLGDGTTTNADVPVKVQLPTERLLHQGTFRSVNAIVAAIESVRRDSGTRRRRVRLTPPSPPSTVTGARGDPIWNDHEGRPPCLKESGVRSALVR